MAYEIPGNSITLKAPTTGFSLSQYRFVVASSSDGFFKAGSSVSTNRPVGILQNAPSVAGEACQVMVTGVSKFKTDSTIAAGANVVSGDSGVAVSTGSVTRNTVMYGPVLTATAGSSNLGTIVLDKVLIASSS